MQERWYYFIDARTGELVESYDATVYDGPQVAQAVGLDGVTRTLNVYQKGSKYHLLDASRPSWRPNQADPVDDPERMRMWELTWRVEPGRPAFPAKKVKRKLLVDWGCERSMDRPAGLRL